MNPKKILITGAGGQLGNEMRNVLDGNAAYDVIYTDVAELDITDAAAVQAMVRNEHVDVIVNCAAFTAVDAAEDAVELCTRLNVEAPANLATAARDVGAHLIHISTDYVFDGTQCRPYREDDPTCPASVYGSTKLAGEDRIREILPDAVIIRTAWLYSQYGKNFVKTMLRLGTERDSLRVVFDQVGSPTWAHDLALAVKTVIDAPQWHAGLYHYSNEGVISWYDFTIAIHRIAGITCDVQPCLSNEYPTRATRPHYSVLDKSKFKATFGVTIPYWATSLETCVKQLLS